jgi:hypothetical protein
MALRYEGTCAACGTFVAARSKAWWDSAGKLVTCVSCLPANSHDSPPPDLAPQADAVLAGVDARPAFPLHPSSIAEWVESRRPRSTSVEAPSMLSKSRRSGVPGASADSPQFMSDEPHSTTAWAKGADGERRLAQRLTDELVDVAIVLHDRKVPGTRGNIDHLVIAPAGVWVVDAENYNGRVEQRDVGGWLTTDKQLYVNGRNQTKLITGMTWQVEAVQAALATIGFEHTPVHPALCFVSSEWGLFAKPFRLDGTLVTWPKKLLEEIRIAGPADQILVETLARQLSAKLPAST